LRLCIKNDVRAMEEMMMMTGPEQRQVRSGLAGLKAATIPPLFFARIRLGRIFQALNTKMLDCHSLNFINLI